MEVEVKLRLPNSAAHQLLSDALIPFHRQTQLHENFFFDSNSGELSSQFAVARIRFHNSDSRCVLSLKSRPNLLHGISRVEEIEEEIDSALGRACVADPSCLCSIFDSSEIMRRIRDEYGIGGGFVCLGGFRNVRMVYEWEGLVLELDETRFEFGTSYELECETGEPEKVRGILEGFLRGIGVDYCYSNASKFAVFRAGKLIS